MENSFNLHKRPGLIASSAGAIRRPEEAGEAGLRKVITDGGCTRFRRSIATPFTLVFEARR